MDTDITTRLRQTRADMLGTPDEDHFYDCHEAAGEIERLRQWGRLTDAERYAVMAGLRSLERTLWADPENLGGEYRDIQRYAATLRALLERTQTVEK